MLPTHETNSPRWMDCRNVEVVGLFPVVLKSALNVCARWTWMFGVEIVMADALGA